MRFRVKTSGFGRVGRAMRGLREPAQRLVRTGALLRNGRRIQRRTQRGPLSGGRLKARTGELRSSIRVVSRDLPNAIEVGTDVVYGGVQEFGWPAKNIPAARYLRAGYDLEADELLEDWIEEIDRQIARSKEGPDR